MNFTETGAIHENASRVFEDGLWMEIVDFPELAAFDRARRAFAESVNRHALEGPWIELIESLKLVHARVARTPCRPSWLFSQERFTMREQRLEPQLRARLRWVDPTVRSGFDRVQEALRVLANVEITPVTIGAGRLIACFRAGSRNVVAIRDAEVWDECGAQLSQQVPGLGFEIRKPTELRDHPSVDQLILFGPPWLLRYRNESFLLGSPVAPSVWFVVCRHEHVGVVPQSGLEECTTHRLNGVGQSLAEVETNLEHEPMLFQPRAFVLKHGQDSGLSWVAGPDDTTSALPLVLGGGKGIYIQEEGGLYTTITGVDSATRPCLTVERLDACEIETGMLVLLTTKGGGDMIPVVADSLLKDEAKTVRELEILWKRRLADKAERLGITKVAQCLHTSPQNVRNWCSPRNIAPENLEDHLLPILELVGLKPYYPKMVEAIGKLRSAHQSAGMRLQAHLLQSLKGLDLRAAYVNGFQEIRDKAGGPVKTVYLVQEVKGMEEVSTRLVGRVLELED